jgi:superfamily II DNA or RNA helicase
MRETSFCPGDQVRTNRFGIGRVVVDNGLTVVVRYEHGLEECEAAELEPVDTPWQVLARPEWHAPLEVITRSLGAAIRSVNDAWGVFSCSRITLLPHQLWVCRQVNRERPTRWLVADDVGLGKTIEAGLILLPLLSRGDVRRLLILCPASLVEQWQYRMRTMFGIRLTAYTTEADTPKADFWNTHNQMIASVQTLRLLFTEKAAKMRQENRERCQRLLEADAWDMVVVDEAHHLNADEQTGPTLGYKLIEGLLEANRIGSMVFFTGTPHRGKNYGFLALLRLLRPDLFDPRQPVQDQLPNLKLVMIRNNKHNVTDLAGNRLFQEPLVRAETYAYTPEEAQFYQMLTEFILTGKAYAQTLAQSERRTVILVLIAMQKLASSSVAAIRRALHGRLARIVAGRKRLAELEERFRSYREREEEGDTDTASAMEEQIAELSAQIVLMTDEEPRLRELVAAADAVTEETKVRKILELLEGPFASRPVLMFTEYKATQSLLMSKLLSRFGPECVTFINGDGRADGVSDGAGPPRTLTETRERAADRFNAGHVRFLISTEAGGEGIDLQQNCHSLIHIDLPWNPMRLHQRVGRLNRYGQTRKVEVFTVRNPDTVEARIWVKLNAKIEQIMRALGRVMREPEDLLQLVLGMSSPTLFREIFTEAASLPPDSLSDWFDAKTAQFGGEDVLAAVQDLVGNCTRFDFQQASPQIPRLDLPDLKPFFKATLSLNKRKVQEESDGLTFLTPETWAKFSGVRREYQKMVFERAGKDPQRVLGVGHRLVDQALAQACGSVASVAAVPDTVLEFPLYVYTVTDRVTSTGGQVRSVTTAVEVRPDGYVLLRDSELILRLNQILAARDPRRFKGRSPVDPDGVRRDVEAAGRWLADRLSELDVPFRVPTVGCCCLLLPNRRIAPDADGSDKPLDETPLAE